MTSLGNSGSSWREGPVSPSPGTSPAVSVVMTPGSSSAGVASRRVTRAWACGAVTGHACRRCGKRPRRSSVYIASPVTCPRALSCGTGLPEIVMTRVPPEFLDQAFRHLAAVLLRSAMIAHRFEDALEHLLRTLDGILVPGLADDGLLRFSHQQRCRGDAAEGEPRPPYSTGVVTIERHRRRDRAD